MNTPEKSHNRRDLLMQVVSKLQSTRTDGYLGALGVLIGNSSPHRREVLKAPIVLTLLFSRKQDIARQPQISPIEYEYSLGIHRSYPWLPLDASVEGGEATGLNEGGPWDKYDAVDQAINGSRARSIYWPKLGGFASTREWLSFVAHNALHEDGENAYYVRRSWGGYCSAAGAASYFAPPVEGSIEIAGIEFAERERLVVATMRWAGLFREVLDLSDIEEVRRRIANREPVLVDNSDTPGQEWWGLARKISTDGTVTITRFIKWNEGGLQTKYKHISQLGGAYVAYPDKPQPRYEGSFAVVDRSIGGLILGTHQLVD